MTATDLDLGTNGVITYSITEGNVGDAFTIGGWQCGIQWY